MWEISNNLWGNDYVQNVKQYMDMCRVFAVIGAWYMGNKRNLGSGSNLSRRSEKISSRE